MRKKFFTILLLCNSLYALKGWTACQKMTDFFYFSSFDLQLRLTESAHNDSGLPLFLVRLFHNKVVGALIDSFRSYTLFWDLRLIISLVGFIGICFFFLGIYYLITVKKKSRMLWIVLIWILLLPFIIMNRLPIPFHMALSLYTFALLIFAKFGFDQVIGRYPRFFIVAIVLFLLSIWWNTVYNPISLQFCMA
jgi:hypothetical protein